LFRYYYCDQVKEEKNIRVTVLIGEINTEILVGKLKVVNNLGYVGVGTEDNINMDSEGIA
jgi:hypothetical protein